MSLLDVALVLATIAFAVGGFRQGFVTAVLSFLGFFGGAVLGAQLADPVADRLAPDSSWRVAVAVAVVLALALLGQVIAVGLGNQLRQRLTWRPVQRLDALLGALVSAVAVLLVFWMVATPLASAPYPRLSSAVRDSQVVRAVDDVVPRPVRSLYTSLRDAVRGYDFPEVFGPLVPTRVRDVPKPDPVLVRSRGVAAARDSVVKITGLAGSCGRRVEGSGFVYARDRIMTNAHVVAGVDQPAVEVGDEQRAATVVLYDPAKDVAVLLVPDLGLRPLPFAPRPVDTGDDAVVLGFPEDGSFFAGAARIRDRLDIRGPDIYDDRTVTRQVYSIYGDVRSGNSGGPLIAPDGAVLGVIFAAAVDQQFTGFALTAAEVAADARAGRASTAAVPTGDCA
ncbi:MAG TPA: MarP family serine protease [Mycobacteriales bacterium]